MEVCKIEFLCYTHIVDANPHIWRVWIDHLHMWGVQEMAASLLEALGPLTIIGAQVVYLGEPLLQQTLPEKNLQALAEMLEKPDQTKAFIELLRR